jgi:hypothetical protein
VDRLPWKHTAFRRAGRSQWVLQFILLLTITVNLGSETAWPSCLPVCWWRLGRFGFQRRGL